MNPNLTPRPRSGPHHMPATAKAGHGEARPGAAAGGRAAWPRLPELLPLLGPGLSTPRDNRRPLRELGLSAVLHSRKPLTASRRLLSSQMRKDKGGGLACLGKQWVFPRTQAGAQGHPRRRRSRASGRDSGRVLGSAGPQIIAKDHLDRTQNVFQSTFLHLLLSF